MKRTGVGLLALGAVLLVGTWAPAAPANLASLQVIVVDHNGLPIEGTWVLVETDRDEQIAVTDETGSAVFVLKARGNEPLEVSVWVLGGGDGIVPLARGEEGTVVVVGERTPDWTIDEN